MVKKGIGLLLAVVLAVFGLPVDAGTAAGAGVEQAEWEQLETWLAEAMEDPAAENPALALLSLKLVRAARDGAQCTELLREGGFEEINAFNYGMQDPEKHMGITAGTAGVKRIGEKRVALVAVQSENYGCIGWLQNMTMNGEKASGDHAGYTALLDSIPLPEDADLYWLTGHSRGGAISDILGAKLLREGKRVIAYTFEAPSCTDAEDAGSERYASLHNYICSDDPIVRIVPAAWGMRRYGQEYVLNRDEDLTAVMTELKSLAPGLFDAADGTYARKDKEGVYRANPAVMSIVDLIQNGLEQAVPVREEYSRRREDAILTADGEITAVYDGQSVMRALIRVTMGEENGAFSAALGRVTDGTDLLSGQAEGAVKEMLYNLLDGYYAEEYAREHPEAQGKADALYWAAADTLWTALTADGQYSPSFTEAELYGALKLLSPLFLKPSRSVKGMLSLAGLFGQKSPIVQCEPIEPSRAGTVVEALTPCVRTEWLGAAVLGQAAPFFSHMPEASAARLAVRAAEQAK